MLVGSQWTAGEGPLLLSGSIVRGKGVEMYGGDDTVEMIRDVCECLSPSAAGLSSQGERHCLGGLVSAVFLLGLPTVAE